MPRGVTPKDIRLLTRELKSLYKKLEEYAHGPLLMMEESDELLMALDDIRDTIMFAGFYETYLSSVASKEKLW